MSLSEREMATIAGETKTSLWFLGYAVFRLPRETDALILIAGVVV